MCVTDTCFTDLSHFVYKHNTIDAELSSWVYSNDHMFAVQRTLPDLYPCKHFSLKATYPMIQTDASIHLACMVPDIQDYNLPSSIMLWCLVSRVYTNGRVE